MATMRPRVALLAWVLSVLGCREASQNPTISADPVKPASSTSASASASIVVEHGPCPAATVTVDGKAMQVKSARAYGFVDAGASHSVDGAKKDAFVVVLSSAELSCAQILSGSWPVGKDDVFIDVGTGPLENAHQFVTSQNETAKVRTELTRRAEKPGGTVAICVREKATLKTSMIKSSTIELQGLIQGTHCGELK